MRYLLMLAVLAAGFLQPFQAGMNATGARHLGSRFQAGWLNGTVNMVLLTTVLLVLLAFNGKGGGGGLPSPGQVRGLPWWTFLAGAIGATIVVTQLSAAPSLGAGLLVALFVAGTAAGSVVCDRFGLVGYERVSIPWDRILGLCLVVAGVILVARPGAEGR